MKINKRLVINLAAAVGIIAIIEKFRFGRIDRSFIPIESRQYALSIEREKLGKIYVPREHLTKEMYNLK